MKVDVFDAEKFAENVYKARKELQLSLSQLAADAGLDASNIWLVEHHKKTYAIVNTVIRLCLTLGLDINDYIINTDKF